MGEVYRARFEREARAVSSLNHPHICTLFDVGRDGKIDYLVMELVEGETLADDLKSVAYSGWYYDSVLYTIERSPSTNREHP